MRKIKIPLAILVSIIISCSVVITLSDAQYGASVEKLSSRDNGKKITIKVGDIIQIELESIGAAGYSWHSDVLGEKCLELTGEKTEAAHKGGLTGAPVKQIWKLKARMRGETEVKLLLYRLWEGKEKAIDTFRIRVRVL